MTEQRAAQIYVHTFLGRGPKSYTPDNWDEVDEWREWIEPLSELLSPEIMALAKGEISVFKTEPEPQPETEPEPLPPQKPPTTKPRELRPAPVRRRV